MSGLSASSSFVPSLSTSTMASTSSTSAFTESPPVLSACPSVPPSVAATISPAASNEKLSVSSAFSSAATYVSGTISLPSSTTSVISDSSPQSMSSSLAAISSNASTPLSSFTSQYVLYPETSASVTQTSTTNEQAQITSSAPVSVTTSANRDVSEPVGTSTQPGGALATYTQTGTTSISNSFSNNRGAIIGTFVAVALFSTAIFACLCVAWRRHLRRRTGDGLHKTTKLLRDDASRGFRDGPHDQPMTSMISDGTVTFTQTCRSDVLPHGISAGLGEILTSSISAPVTGNTRNWTGLHYDGPFSDYFATDCTSRGLTGSATTANLRTDSPVPSLAPSTPSIYSPSLPPIDTEHNVTRSMVYSACLSTPSINPPPHPLRRKRPPPPLFMDFTEAAAIPSGPTTPVSVDIVIPPSSSPPDSFSPPSSVKHAKHKSSKLSEESQSLTPPSIISDHSQMDS